MSDDRELRRRLQARAESFGPAEDLRADVRRRLETLETSTRRPLIPEEMNHRRPSTRRLVAAAAACLILAFGGLFLLTRSGETDQLTTESTFAVATLPAADTSAPAPSTDRLAFESTRTRPRVRFDLPDEPTTSLVSESGEAIEFRFDTSAGDGRLVILLPPADDVGSIQESVEWLESSLAQTTLDAVDQVMVGTTSATRLRLVSEAGMTITGFRFGPQTFLSASGVDRRYESWLTTRSDGGVVVVWVDTSDDVDASVAQGIADVVLPNLDTGF